MQAVTAFQTQKPKPDRVVRVVAIDDATGKSRSTTVYDTTPEDFIAAVKGEKPNASRPRRAPSHS